MARIRADSLCSGGLLGERVEGSGEVDLRKSSFGCSSLERLPWLTARVIRKRCSSSRDMRNDPSSLLPRVVGVGAGACSSEGLRTNMRGSSSSSSLLSSKFQNCFSASHHSTTRLRLAMASKTCTYQFRPCQSGCSSQALPMNWTR